MDNSWFAVTLLFALQPAIETDLEAQLLALLICIPMLVLMSIIFVNSLNQAKKTKNKNWYLISVFSGTFKLAVVMVILGQYILPLIIMIGATLFGVATYSKWIEAIHETTIKTKIPDISGSLRPKDLFIWFTWPLIGKLERIYGEYKARLLWTTVVTSIISGTMLILYLIDIITYIRQFAMKVL